MRVNKNIYVAAAIAAAAIVIMSLYVLVISPKLIEPADTYSKAMSLYAQGDYVRAALRFESLGSYSDAEQNARDAWKMAGDEAFNAGRYDEASACYTRSEAGVEDRRKVGECFILQAENAFKNGEFDKAEIYLSCIGDPDAFAERIDAARILGARNALSGGSEKEQVDRAADVIALCREEAYPEISELFFEHGNAMLEDYHIEAAYSAFAAAKRFSNGEAADELLGRIVGAWNDAANRAVAAGDYENAGLCMEMAENFEDPSGSDNPSSDERYAQAVELYDNGDIFGAFALLSALPEDYAEVSELLGNIRSRMQRMPAAGGSRGYALLSADGSVGLFGSGWGEDTQTPNVRNAAAVAVGREAFGLVLSENGTVVGFGDDGMGKLNVGDWTDIIAIACGGKHSLGLRSDGTVAAVGWDMYGQRETAYWSYIVAIAAGENTSYGVTTAGKVVAIGDNSVGQCDVGGWTDIKTVSAGRAHAVGITNDGHAVACGDNSKGQCAVENWANIVMLSCGAEHTVALHGDGTLVACGSNANGECDVSGITDAVAVSCGDGYTLVLLANGTCRVLGSFDPGQPAE